MPELVDPIDDLQVELAKLRQSECQLKERQIVLLRLALSQQNPNQSFDAKLRTFTKEVGNFLQVERTSLWFLDRDNTSLRCLNLYVRSEDQHFSGEELRTRKFPRYLDFLSQEGVIAADYARTDEQTEEFDSEYLTKHGITSMLDTPLRVGDRLRGVLCCEHVGTPRHWTEDDRQFVISLADLASLTLATHDVSRTEEMLRALLDSAAQGVVAVDENGKIALVNSLIEKMFLYKREELLGQPLEMLIPRDLCDSYLKFPCDKSTGRHTLVPPVGKYFHGQRQDGSEFPLEIALSDVQLHDERMSLALLTDATQRAQIEQRLKKSEELYRSVVEDQVDLIARYTPEGIRTFANDAYCRFLGRTREELIGHPLWEHIPVDDHDRMRENFARLTKDHPVLYYEHCDLTYNGKVVVNQWIDRAIFDANGDLREIQCIGRDVTKQRATEERLTAAERLESIAMLASGIAHDFNNLLTPILIYSENLQTRLKDGSIEANQVQQIHLAADRAKTLVRQILTFGRKGERAERLPTAVTAMLNDALQLIRLSVPAHIRLETHIDEDCGVIISDAAELYQVLSNLCSNACYAMDQGGILTVTAQKKHFSSDELPVGEYARITVVDQGRGISSVDLHRIFDPFFSTKPEGEGTGLGLSVVHGTVKDLGGSIKVESRVGEGTTFMVMLPCTTQMPTTADQEGKLAELAEMKSHVLLVDDDDLALKSMQLVLKQLGHQVTACSSAQEALSCLSQTREPFDVLLSDFTMPRMSGLELAEQVHKSHPRLPILLITGDAGQVDEAAAKGAGIAGFIAKPAGSRELSAALSQITRSQPAAVVKPMVIAQQHVLVIDDNELVRESLLSLLKTIGFSPHATASISEARQLLEQQPVDAVLVDHHLDGENGFEEAPRLFADSRAASGRVPLLIGMTGSEYLPDVSEHQLDAFLTKPFTAEQLRKVLLGGSTQSR
ncbi:MAG: PAS domain S-box protein [Bythopirellula sp.]|nr:PAS domain S-box protein [Bythopirellula sp.]